MPPQLPRKARVPMQTEVTPKLSRLARQGDAPKAEAGRLHGLSLQGALGDAAATLCLPRSGVRGGWLGEPGQARLELSAFPHTSLGRKGCWGAPGNSSLTPLSESPRELRVAPGCRLSFYSIPFHSFPTNEVQGTQGRRARTNRPPVTAPMTSSAFIPLPSPRCTPLAPQQLACNPLRLVPAPLPAPTLGRGGGSNAGPRRAAKG